MREYRREKLKHNAWNLLFLLLGVLCWIFAIHSQKQIEYYHGSVSVRYAEPILTENKIQAALEAMSISKEPNIPEVTLWKRTEKVEIRNSSLGRTARCNLIEVNGDMSELFPGILLEGGYLFQEDFTGCVIDSETAYQLFSTLDVIGLILEYHDTEYIIRGVLKTPGYNFMVAVSNDPDKVTGYDCMELRFAEQEEAQALAEAFVFAYDLAEPSAYINGYLYQELSKQLISIPLWLFAFWLLWIYLRIVYSYRASIPLLLLGAGTFIALAFIVLKLVNFQIYIPSAIIPSRWSDLDYWAILWSKIKASLADREQIMQYYKDVVLRKEFHKVITGSILVAGLEICLYVRLDEIVTKKIMERMRMSIQKFIQEITG